MSQRLGCGQRLRYEMASVKFDQVEATACEMQVSRNHLFVLVMEQFIEHHRNQRLFEEINAAYEDMPDPAEQDRQQRMRRQHR